METVLDLPKVRAREQGVPAKVLLVDDDELELSLMSDRLTHAGFQVTIAHNGEEALQILEAQWFPIVLTDWQMPVMDGIQLIEKLRERGGDDSYFIMLSVRAGTDDFERGYCAGVDDYLSKKSPDTEIMARIEAGLNTVALRRSLRNSRAALATSQSQLETVNADARMQLLKHLQSELARSKRYRRACSILMLGVHPKIPSNHNSENSSLTTHDQTSQQSSLLDDSVRSDFLQAVQGVLRIDIDTVWLYDAGEHHVQFALLLPETGPAEVAIIRSRVRAALTQRLRERFANPELFDVSVGAGSLDPAIECPALTAEEMITAADNCRRCMASCGARRLAAVQTSVMSQVAIPCRYGYAVADHCLELDHRYADESKHRLPAAEASPVVRKTARAVVRRGSSAS